MRRRREIGVDRTRVLLILAVMALIFVVVIAGVFQNDLNYTTTAGGLFVVLGWILGRNGKSGEDDEP